MEIGIIGQGYVGTALKKVFEKYYNINTYDINKKLSTVGSISELAQIVDLIFICIPTPMNKDGSCDICPIEEVISDIDSSSNKKCNLVAIKSTIPPGTTSKLDKKSKNIDIVFNPEFLTEAILLKILKIKIELFLEELCNHRFFQKDYLSYNSQTYYYIVLRKYIYLQLRYYFF